MGENISYTRHKTPLHMIVKPNPDIIPAFLLESGSNSNTDKKTPIKPKKNERKHENPSIRGVMIVI